MQNKISQPLSVTQEFSSVFHIFFSSLRDIWEDLWIVLVVNLIWTICVILLIPGPPATLALFHFVNRMAHGEVVDLSDFIQYFRGSWLVGWHWGLVNLVIVGVFVGDILITSSSLPTNAMSIQGFYLTAIFLWFLLQLYVLPFLIEQEKPGMRMAFHNSLIMAGRNVSFSVLLGLFTLILLIFGTLLCMITFTIGGVFLADIGNRAVINRLEKVATG
jgi:uncharacterized membrane protein YesL